MGHALACPFLLAITIVGYNDMAAIFANLNALFLQTHPATKLTLHLKGTATAAPALTLGLSDLAPMGAEFSDMELQAYRSHVGTDPIAIRVAHCSLNPRALSAPVGIYVNQANPIQTLTTSQVGRIFTTGHLSGDLTHWGQVGLTGEWSTRPIHPAGIAEEAAAGLASFMLKKMSARAFTPEYDGFAQSTQVVRRVSEDPGAIGFASGNIAIPGTKLVTIDGIALTEPNVVDGAYPYDRHLLIYVRRVDPSVKDYLRLVLSQEGQQAIAAAPPNYLPLNAREIKEELAKLNVSPKPPSHSPESSNPKIALYRLITGASPFVLIDREIWPLEIRPFRQNYGYEPTVIRIAHSFSRDIYVNSKNPLTSLTMEQLTRMFTTGSSAGDITHWSQLGWTDRTIHVYGPHDDGTFITALRHAKMGGFPFARAYESMSSSAGILDAVANDPYGIAIIEQRDAKLPATVKALPLADLSSHLNLYVNRPPGKPLDSATEEYARKLLSTEGQAEFASQGYTPLTAKEIADELKKL